MSLDGLWSSEIFGLRGWESTGVLMLQAGHAIGGGNNHHSMGRYDASGDEVDLSLVIDYHGKPRTMFGSSEKKFEVQLKGRIAHDVIEGLAYRPDNEKLSLNFRLTKRAELPE